jgi:hypothetical protein
MFVCEEDKRIYRFLRGCEGTCQVLMGDFLYGLWRYLKYTLLLML